MVTLRMEYKVFKPHAFEVQRCGVVYVGRELAWVSSSTLHKMGCGGPHSTSELKAAGTEVRGYP